MGASGDALSGVAVLFITYYYYQSVGLRKPPREVARSPRRNYFHEISQTQISRNSASSRYQLDYKQRRPDTATSVHSPSARIRSDTALPHQSAPCPPTDLARIRATEQMDKSGHTLRQSPASHQAVDSVGPSGALQIADEPSTLLFLFTGEGAHSDITDIDSLRAGPSWAHVEAALQRLGVADDLEALLRTALGVHEAPMSPVVTTIINILNAEHWRAAGFQPTHVLGHSIGEVAAANAAGMLALDDALNAAVVLGHIGAQCSGAMLHTKMPQLEIASWPEREGALAIAAINGFATMVADDPSSQLLGVTLCGQSSDVDSWLRSDPAAKRLVPPHPWHHPMYLDAAGVADGSAFATIAVAHAPAAVLRPAETHHPRFLPCSSPCSPDPFVPTSRSCPCEIAIFPVRDRDLARARSRPCPRRAAHPYTHSGSRPGSRPSFSLRLGQRLSARSTLTTGVSGSPRRSTLPARSTTSPASASRAAAIVARRSRPAPTTSSRRWRRRRSTATACAACARPRR